MKPTGIRTVSSIDRRDFVKMALAGALAGATGCATNPVTGERQFLPMSEAMEIETDRKWAPHQFSTDYGAVQDADVNAYVSDVGRNMATHTHRPDMPYNFRVVNAVVVNGYTFPGGSVALARGLMLSMNDEAELASVLGHELGHVNARHAAELMGRNLLVNAVVLGAGAYLESRDSDYAALATGLGAIGANALLAHYSRDNERQADELGMEYTFRAGRNPHGMVDLLDTFRLLQKTKPGTVDLLFATHPMSGERYGTAVRRLATRYPESAGMPEYRERYMDRTASIRAKRDAIERLQAGESLIVRKRYRDAETRIADALRLAPDDYVGLLLMAKCLTAQNRLPEAARYVAQARAVYPAEPQALHVGATLDMRQGRFDTAAAGFTQYEQRLPGNPETIFSRGFCHQQAGRRDAAVADYLQYRRLASAGTHAAYVNQQLLKWKVIAAP